MQAEAIKIISENFQHIHSSLLWHNMDDKE